MSIRYYYSELIPDPVDGIRQYRLFAILCNSWYWAIEWKCAGKDQPSHLTDFNAGTMSATVSKGLLALKSVTFNELRSNFGTFADYIERAAGEYGDYVKKIGSDAEKQNVVWRISES